MTYQFRLREEPFEFYPQFDNAEGSLATDFAETWQGEVSRKSPDYIRWVQRSLNQILGLQLAVDGDLGSQTRSAIRSFQQRQGLKVDGIVGSQTESALIAAGATALPLSGVPSEPQEPLAPVPATPLGRRCRFRFSPGRVEVPGGGRIKDKTPPNPNELVEVEGVGSRRIPLQRLAAEAWKALVGAARSNGIPHPLLLPTSGFRDPEHQRRLWEQAKVKYGSPQAARKWVAPPGSSPHQSGRAIDFYLGGKNSSGNVANLRRLPAYRWLVENAECFGFYPYEAEPWHWEYNPPSTPPNELQELVWLYAEPGALERGAAFDRNRPEYIRWVQQSLNRILGLRLPSDGTLRPQTRNAIRTFQERKGLRMDGILGPETQQALGLARKRVRRVDIERTKPAYKGPFASADYETEAVEAAALGLAAVQFGRDLLTSGGEFRHDLYYRMANWVCQLSPLRERSEDILLLTQYFLRELQHGGEPPELAIPVRSFLLGRDYPGNVRELKQLVSRISYRHVGEGPITVGDIPEDERPLGGEHASKDWRDAHFEQSVRHALDLGIGLKELKQATTAIAIRIAVNDEDGNLQRAAHKLGVTDRALQMRRANGH